MRHAIHWPAAAPEAEACLKGTGRAELPLTQVSPARAALYN